MNYLLEIVVILLLGMTVMFCWRLNSKITEIKSTRKDMAGLVKIFDEAIMNTNHSVGALKDASASAATDLKKYTIKSHEMISELAFMNDTAVRLADRLEGIIFEAKNIESRCALLIEKASKVQLPLKRAPRKSSALDVGNASNPRSRRVVQNNRSDLKNDDSAPVVKKVSKKK